MRTESDKAAAAAAAADPSLKKDRHIVSWSPQEDELLRQQVSVLGTENWASIAAKFKDKTGRQCRRRWYTYLNAEGKKGGWSAEEDMLLCEAQKIFGNRWTEIAKVVSGRTDNAVKNRFTTLCKKKTKLDALSKENDNSSYINPNNKRVLVQNEPTESSATTKQTRYHQILDHGESHNTDEGLLNPATGGLVHLRPPLTVLDQNIQSVGGLLRQCHPDNTSKTAIQDASSNNAEGSFLKRDDPKLTALLQQAELLSSLALKVNSENTNQSLENAWKELQDYLIQNGERSASTRTPDMDFLLDDFTSLIEDLKSSSMEEHIPQRNPGLHDNYRGHFDSSTESIQSSHVHKENNKHTEDATSGHNPTISCHQEPELGCSISTSHGNLCMTEPAVGDWSCNEESKVTVENIYTMPCSEFESPCETIPTFKSLKEGIPSPNFSASERQFLLNVLGMSSPAPNTSSAQQPSCKRVLLDSL